MVLLLFALRTPRNVKVPDSEVLGETLTLVRGLAHRNPLPYSLQF